MAHSPDLKVQDAIILNTSGGKDSQTMIEVVYAAAVEAGVTDKLVAIHCDLGRVEWADTKELAQKQAEQYGIPFVVVSRPQGDLLDQIVDQRVRLDRQADEAEAAGDLELAAEKRATPAFPSSDARYCTSDQKTSQVAKYMTALVEELGASGALGEPTGFVKSGPNKGAPKYRQARILNVLGIRADESPARSKKSPLHQDAETNGLRLVTRWLPIFEWTEAEVWASIKASGVPYHRAYDLGMSRLSCAFCVFASKADLVISARANPELAREYVAVEILTRSQFKGKPGSKNGLSMTDIIALASSS